MHNTQILIVDDLPDNTFLMNGLLIENGYEPLIANSASECFEILENNQPEIILMDIMMPVMTGLEALDIIQKDSELRKIPVIMVSAKTDSKDIELALNKGAVDYIKKPIDEVEMFARIKTALRLKESEDEMRSMLKSYESFIRMVSHDLRSPFTTIQGFAELLLNDSNLENKQKEALQFIIDSTNKSVEYFNKLLNWSKMGSSEIELSKKNISVKKILEYSKALFCAKAFEKNISLEIFVGDDFELYADEVYISQVINNLINNAIKFTPNKGRIEVSAFKIENKPRITIYDNGIGMPEISESDIFSNRINKTRKGTNGEKGTGIGLSISKKIIDAHGYKISFESEKDTFTKFLIEC